MLTLSNQFLPEELTRLAQSPRQLYASGGGLSDLMQRPRLAIVGSRKVTPYGKTVTNQLARELASKGVVIISGLALGVDSIAHAGCLEVGGVTIAVLPCSLETVYPRSHTNLAKRIVDSKGLLISEYPIPTPPYPANFLERNRLIAALAEGVVVTEAAARSGSLNTANHALELGLPVFAVPGNITNPMSTGCNNLIKAGAIPVTSTDDIIKELNWQLVSVEKIEIVAANKAEHLILQCIQSGISDATRLLADTGLEPALFNQTLTMLEITGRIRPLGANHWSLP